jgi:outer membrane protein OmpA-like peptidoglycan-associated protein
VEELNSIYPTLKNSELATNWYAEILHEMGETQTALKLVDEHLKNFYWHIPILMSKLQLVTESNHIQTQQLMDAKRAAQLALDQLPFYLEKNTDENGEELSVLFLKDQEQIKADLQKKLKTINSRLTKS